MCVIPLLLGIISLSDPSLLFSQGGKLGLWHQDSLRDQGKIVFMLLHLTANLICIVCFSVVFNAKTQELP